MVTDAIFDGDGSREPPRNGLKSSFNRASSGGAGSSADSAFDGGKSAPTKKHQDIDKIVEALARRKLYTQNLTGELKEIVAAIHPHQAEGATGTGRRHDSFSTMEFSRPISLDMDELVFLRAQYNAQTKLWNVYQFSLTVHEDKSVRPAFSHNILGDLRSDNNRILADCCFFDALYFCALVEKSMKEGGFKAELKAEEEYFRDVAHHAGIPFDENSMPHPAWEGDILTKGTFSQEEIRVATKTRSWTQDMKDRAEKIQAPDLMAAGSPLQTIMTEATAALAGNIKRPQPQKKDPNAQSERDMLFKDYYRRKP